MSPVLRILSVVVLLTSGYAAAASDPHKRYNVDTGCAADIQVSIAQNALPANITVAQAQPVGVVFAKRAIASGRAVGCSPERVFSDIANLRSAMLKSLANPDAAKAKAERTTDANMVTKCTAVFGYELERAVVGSR